MECNKDEARRAMDIAERKVTENDFVEAKRFATKAQNLFPQTDGLKQLLMVIDVYISAANKITGGEADWYGILGVDPLADDVALKKQYRKLALMLHPDKNKCKGAEGAFKLVLEAWNLLSDQAKRFAYNQKRMMTNKVQQTKSRKKPPPKSASSGAENGKDSGATSSRKRKGKQTKNDMKPPPQPASNEAQNAKENAASSGRKSKKAQSKSEMKPPPQPGSNESQNAKENAASSGRKSKKAQQPKSEMKPPPQPASNEAQKVRDNAASSVRKSEKGQQTRSEMKPPPEPASNGMNPPHQPASNGMNPPHQPASNGMKPPPEPASNEMKPPPEPASNGMNPPPKPASNGMKSPHKPASNDRQNVRDSSTASSRRTRSKSATAPVDSSSTNRKVKNITFWTMCNGCRTKYLYVKAFYHNKALVCRNCRQTFIATEIIPEPSVVKQVNNSGPQQHQTMDSSNTPNAVNQAQQEVKRGLEDSAAKVAERIVKKRRT